MKDAEDLSNFIDKTEVKIRNEFIAVFKNEPYYVLQEFNDMLNSALKEQSSLTIDKFEKQQKEIKDSNDLRRFLSDNQDLMDSINFKMNFVNSDELASDLNEAEALVERHKKHRADLDAHSETFKIFELFGKQLLESRHYASVQIEETLKLARDAKGKLEEIWMERKLQLDQCLELQLFYRDCQEAEDWMANRSFLSDDKKSLDAKSPIKHIEDFDEDIAVQEEKMSQLTKFAQQLTSSSHYATDSIETKKIQVLDRWSKFKDALTEKKSKLQALRQLSRNADEVDNCINGKPKLSQLASEEPPKDETRKNNLLSTLQTNDKLQKTSHETQETSNRHSISHGGLPIQIRHVCLNPKIKKWWPESKLLIKSLLKRKYEQKLLINELHDRISKDENRMIVVCESSAATKYSGMGGVGKTLTAKWYANAYEQEYDHIIWIDCGEGSLLTSFETLARDLEIPNRKELVKVQDYSRKCFHVLSGYKCLWIYDNAENYKGEEGIINVLTKDEINFYCIITSRSRELGIEKLGFGKMSNLEIDIFSEEESLEFLTSILFESIGRTDSQLKELCTLTGNLPLALQLTVALLNDGKISLKSYLERNRFEKLVDARFDDYERTINNNVKIALELILKETYGKEAHQMLLIFGYIRPYDVEFEFLMKVLNYDNEEKLKGAIKILNKYSLVGRNKVQIDNETKITLSVHRLLQQVIRHNGRENEKETLKKILGCVGFIDYKLIPFTKYADEELRIEFPKVKAELLDQQQLKKLLRVGRVEESVQLARFIDEELNTIEI